MQLLLPIGEYVNMLDRVLTTQPISNFRKFGNEILAATERGPVLVTQHGIGAGVLLSVEHYNNIASYLRAFYDADLFRRLLSDMDEGDGTFVTFEEFSQNLRHRGLVNAT